MSEEFGELVPVKPARIAQELAKLSAAYRSGEFKQDQFDQRFARIIQELRGRRIDGTRQDVEAALKPLLDSGDISDKDHFRLLSQLGMLP